MNVWWDTHDGQLETAINNSSSALRAFKQLHYCLKLHARLKIVYEAQAKALILAERR
jgi:hypothetical protein